jgi:hypothetical protein
MWSNADMKVGGFSVCPISLAWSALSHGGSANGIHDAAKLAKKGHPSAKENRAGTESALREGSSCWSVMAARQSLESPTVQGGA